MTVKEECSQEDFIFGGKSAENLNEIRKRDRTMVLRYPIQGSRSAFEPVFIGVGDGF
jgi:hypothetical protein